jgi:hypothetical protein
VPCESPTFEAGGDVVLTRQDSNAAKGIAISLMLMHHLYANKDRIIHGNTYVPLLAGVDLEGYLGNFAKVCVPMFLFLSGYGLYKSTEGRVSIVSAMRSRTLSFYKGYWMCFAIFVPIGLLCFREARFPGRAAVGYGADWVTFVKGLAGISTSYNAEWWFVKLYLLILLVVFPLYRHLADRRPLGFVFVPILLYAFSAKVNSVGNIMFYQLSFAAGVGVAKHERKLGIVLHRFHSLQFAPALALVCACVLLRPRLGGQYCDFLLAPALILLGNRLLRLLGLYGALAYVGQHSFQMWLNHSFFCYYYFQDAVFAPRYSPLIFVTLLGMSLAAAIGTGWLRSLLAWRPASV